MDDKEAAESQLPRSVQIYSQITATDFGRKKLELEEIFLNIIEESNHDIN